MRVARASLPRRALVLGGAVLALTTSAACVAQTAVAASNPEASDAVATLVRAHYGSPTDLFVNCPNKNRTPLQDGGTGLGCEFRALVANQVVVGNAVAELVYPGWVVIGDPFFGHPAPNEWRRCGRRSAGGPKDGATGTISVRAHGLVCKFLPLNAGDVRSNVNRRKLRIRPHFHAGRRGTNTIGFIIFAETCHGRAVSPRRGFPGSRVFEATCSNPFGDAFQYRFRVTAPAPPHPHGGGGGGGGGGGSVVVRTARRAIARASHLVLTLTARVAVETDPGSSRVPSRSPGAIPTTSTLMATGLAASRRTPMPTPSRSSARRSD